MLAGHVILKKDDKYYAAPVTGNAYAAFGDKTPVGVLVADVLAEVPMASCLTIGQVRASAAPYPYTDEVKEGTAKHSVSLTPNRDRYDCFYF